MTLMELTMIHNSKPCLQDYILMVIHPVVDFLVHTSRLTDIWHHCQIHCERQAEIVTTSCKSNCNVPYTKVGSQSYNSGPLHKLITSFKLERNRRLTVLMTYLLLHKCSFRLPGCLADAFPN